MTKGMRRKEDQECGEKGERLLAREERKRNKRKKKGGGGKGLEGTKQEAQGRSASKGHCPPLLAASSPASTSRSEAPMPDHALPLASRGTLAPRASPLTLIAIKTHREMAALSNRRSKWPFAFLVRGPRREP